MLWYILPKRLGILIAKIQLTKSKILELATQGKLVLQDSNNEAEADMLRRLNAKARIITDNLHYRKIQNYKNFLQRTILKIRESTRLYGYYFVNLHSNRPISWEK